MRYKNDAPITLYVVVDTEWGDGVVTRTNLQAARSQAQAWTRETGRVHVVRKYDQRGI